MPTFAGSWSTGGGLAWDTCWKELILHNEFTVGWHTEHSLGDWKDWVNMWKDFELFIRFMAFISLHGSTSCFMIECKASVEISTHLPACISEPASQQTEEWDVKTTCGTHGYAWSFKRNAGIFSAEQRGLNMSTFLALCNTASHRLNP